MPRPVAECHIAHILNSPCCGQHLCGLPPRGRPVGHIEIQIVGVIPVIAHPHRETQVEACAEQDFPSFVFQNHPVCTVCITGILTSEEKMSFVILSEDTFRCDKKETVEPSSVRANHRDRTGHRTVIQGGRPKHPAK